MQTCGSRNKSPIKLSAAKIKLTRWFVYEWGKPTWQKSHRVILRSPLPRIHYYQNKWLQVKESQYLIPTYSWTLTPIPNWTCSVMTISPCNARLLEKVVGYKVLQFIQTMKIKKMLGHKTLWYTNTATSSQERWTRANSVSSHNLLEQTLLDTCATCSYFDGP